MIKIDYLMVTSNCIRLLFVCSLLFSLVIETIKTIITEEKIQKIFGSNEKLSLLISLLLGIIIYISYIIFFIIGKMSIDNLDIIKLILIGIIFIDACSIGSQVGYDKVIKTLKEIFINENHDGNEKEIIYKLSYEK